MHYNSCLYENKYTVCHLCMRVSIYIHHLFYVFLLYIGKYVYMYCVYFLPLSFHFPSAGVGQDAASSGCLGQTTGPRAEEFEV